MGNQDPATDRRQNDGGFPMLNIPPIGFDSTGNFPYVLAGPASGQDLWD
jgi:hypothetical protein